MIRIYNPDKLKAGDWYMLAQKNGYKKELKTLYRIEKIIGKDLRYKIMYDSCICIIDRKGAAHLPKEEKTSEKKFGELSFQMLQKRLDENSELSWKVWLLSEADKERYKSKMMLAEL